VEPENGVKLWTVILALLWALPARAQVASPQAIDTPPWFSSSLLNLHEDVREAAVQGKRLMVYFGQDGCPYCKALMQTNFSQRGIVEKTRSHFVAVALNLWGDQQVTWTDGRVLSEKALGRHLRVQFTPTLLFLDEKGGVVARLNGYYPPHRFEAVLDYVSGRNEKKIRIDEYMKTAVKESASPTLHDEPFLLAPPVELRRAKPVALLFETPYCAGCDELHREGFRRAEVRRLVDHFDLYRLTLEERRPGGTTWAQDLGIAYTPTIVFFHRGKEVFRLESYVRPFHLAGALDYVASGAYRKEASFQRYLQARAERLRAQGAPVDLWK
jgi:thioredoxin-related protein